MDPITIALALAQFAPTVLRYLGVGEDNVQVAEKVVDLAEAVTGTKSPEEAIAAIKTSTELQLAFRDKILERTQELERLYYADISDARQRDAEFVKAGKINTRANWLSVLAILVVLVVTVAVWASPDVNDYVKGIITLVLGRFLGYLDQIFNFEFGTTRSSKEKDQTIKALTEK